MKKILGIALMLAVVVSLVFGSVALAADPPQVHTDWEFTGPGSITIDNQKIGGAEGSSSLYVETTGSYSSGWENVNAVPHGYTWCGTNFTVERYAEIDDGVIQGSFVRDNSYPYWPAYTEYGASLETDGSGFIYQTFSNTYSYATFHSHTEVDCPFTMNAGESGSIGGSWSFGIGANTDKEDGSGVLDLNLTDRAEHNGWRLMYGSFYVDADPADAGFGTSWSTLADFAGQVTTPDITQNFSTNVSGSGSYNKDASASWVTIAGYVNGMK